MVVMASATQMTIPAFSPQVRHDRAVVRISGDGALAFLHNLLTMDLSVPAPAYGALLTPQGKILHGVFVVPDGEVIWIDVAADQANDFLKRLMMYRLRAKLDMVIDGTKVVAVSPNDPVLGLSYADPRLKAVGYRAIVDAGTSLNGDGYDAARLTLGLADSLEDIGSGEMFVHEANLDQLNGVSFAKGCYVGQEVVSRTHHRHAARNRVLPIQLAVPAAKGVEITSGEQRVGTMLSSRGKLGIALLRLDRLSEAAFPLMVNGQRLSVLRPTWAEFDLTIPEVAR
jgi:tRNA-modifying protein YgfZ